MQSEIHDLVSEQRQRSSQILGILASYCRRYRMATLNFRGLSEAEIQKLASEVIDFFEHRIREEIASARPGEGAPPASRKP